MAIGESRSEPTTLQYGVPQGSVLGPVLFTVYTGILAFLLEAHGVNCHFFADDIWLYIRVEDIDEAKHRLSLLLSDLKFWMARRKLKLNDGKTEIIVIRATLEMFLCQTLALWCSGSMLASHARGPGFNPRAG